MKRKKIHIQIPKGTMKLIILQPSNCAKKGAGLLWIHGGGYVVGMASMVYMSRAKNLVDQFGITVISPEYRLSNEAPYPYPLLDCYEALLYMREHADELNIRTDQLMVGGESAGGGLAAALCLYARDQKQVNICAQFPLYPMIDDRDTESSKDNHAPVWNTKLNHWAWKKYLRNLTCEIPSYAAPARETDYRNLPPCYTFVGDIEPFYCETLTYVENLKKAGISAEADVYHKCFHAFDMLMPWKQVSRQAAHQFEIQFQKYLQTCFAPQNESSTFL